MTLIDMKDGAPLLGMTYESLRRHRAMGEFKGAKLFYRATKKSPTKMVLENIQAFQKTRLVD